MWDEAKAAPDAGRGRANALARRPPRRTPPRASAASMRWKTMESICVSVALAVVLLTAFLVTRWML